MELSSCSPALTSALFSWKHPPFTFSHRMWKLGSLSSPFLIPGPALLWLPPQYKTDLLPSPCWDLLILLDLPAGKRRSAGCFHTHTLTFEPQWFQDLFLDSQSLEGFLLMNKQCTHCEHKPTPHTHTSYPVPTRPCLLLSSHTNTNIYTMLSLRPLLQLQFWLYQG